MGPGSKPRIKNKRWLFICQKVVVRSFTALMLYFLGLSPIEDKTHREPFPPETAA